jgi:AraC-like DNA-binding protein
LEATPGSILWHLPGDWTIHRNDHENPYQCLVLIFPYRSGDLRPAPRFSRWTDIGAALRFAEEMLAPFHGENPDLVLLAGYAFNVLRWQAARWEKTRLAEELSMPLQRAMLLMERRFAEPLPVDHIAREAGISVAHLHALFHSRFGTSPHQKLVDLRLSEARRLLASTLRSVKDIGSSVGYPDTPGFCKLFRTRCGYRPLEYRHQHLRKDGEGLDGGP